MKNIVIFAVLCLTACTHVKTPAPKYGEYIKGGCHWMGCWTIELSKLKIVEKYESDDLSDNIRVHSEYIVDDGLLKLKGGKKYYYWYLPSKVFGFFGSYYLTDEEIYNQCKGNKECMLPKSYRFHRKI